MTKIDPYINVDAGTMSPYQHERSLLPMTVQDRLNLGNYERFTNTILSKNNSITTGRCIEVIGRESWRLFRKVCASNTSYN